ncbi:MAG: acyl-CoA dehydrogenase family protein [Acidobacteria bacterium]|nr:acyl-CoA dehydrogenase family protein [Acidobacteriota bacterium]
MQRPLLDHPAFSPCFTPEHRDLRERAGRYFEAPRLREWVAAPGGHLVKSQWQELGRLGFLGISLPRELGGQGLGLLGALILSEATSELGDLGLSLGMHCQTEITGHWLATAHGEGLRDRYLPEMIAGRLVGCACDTEPGGQMESTAVRDGGELVVNARKLYVVNGANADLCFVTLKLDGEMSTLLVEKERPGVRVLKVFDKLGTRAIDSAMIDFAEVRVPAANLALKRGVRQLMHWNKVMTVARFLMCADACFLHGRLLKRILEYGGQRIVDGRSLASWPINRLALARAAADQELMRAGLIDRFEHLERRRNAVAEVAALKWFCVDRTTRFAALCAEMQGGAGYMWDSEFLNAHAQILGLKMAGGSLTTMKAIAGQALAYREELEALS